MKSMEGTSAKQSVLIVKPAKTSHQRTLVVLGVERGGTSMVAGVLRALGVNLGEKAGRNHEDPKFLSENREALMSQIKLNNEEHDLWGFKVPKASLMVDFYDEHLRNPLYVLVFRNIASIIDSWCSRGENDPLETAKHCLHYYGAAISSLSSSGRPLAIVNYERACEEREEFVRTLADFVDIVPSDDLVARAMSVITGDGGGYVDIPDYYFHIDAIDPSAILRTPCDIRTDTASPLCNERGPKRVSDRLVLMPKDEYFPKEFYVSFVLDGDRQVISERGLRVYMDFKGDFFPGHAFRPPIRNGRNVLRMLNNGKVRRIAFGPFRQDAIYGVRDMQCYIEGDTSLGNVLKRILAYVKSMLKSMY